MTSSFQDRYAKEFIAGWATMDFNGHMANASGWLDLRARKLVAPPSALFSVFAKVPRSSDFIELPPQATSTSRAIG